MTVPERRFGGVVNSVLPSQKAAEEHPWNTRRYEGDPPRVRAVPWRGRVPAIERSVRAIGDVGSALVSEPPELRERLVVLVPIGSFLRCDEIVEVDQPELIVVET